MPQFLARGNLFCLLIPLLGCLQVFRLPDCLEMPKIIHCSFFRATENLDCIDSDMEVSQICQDDAADPQQQHISFQLPPGDQSVAEAWLIDMLPTTVVTPTAPPMSSTLQRYVRSVLQHLVFTAARLDTANIVHYQLWSALFLDVLVAYTVWCRRPTVCFVLKKTSMSSA